MYPKYLMNDLPDHAPRQRPSVGDDFEAIMHRYRPLVLSVCRAQLSDEHEAEDAAQETFLKFAYHRHAVTGSVPAWLAATARTTAIDRLRREIRRRQRHRDYATRGPSPEDAARERFARHAALMALPEALRRLDHNAQRLIANRYFDKQPLRVLAELMRASVSTLSRQTTAAVDQLAVILKEMGVLDADGLPLKQMLADWGGDASASYFRDGELLAHTHRFGGPAAEAAPRCPGWDRPIRVGVLISHLSLILPMGPNAVFLPHEAQVKPLAFLDGVGFDLVGVVERGGTQFGPVESTLRDFELHAGTIYADDAEALRTLDVIVLGINLKLTPASAEAIRSAVRGGVGLYNESLTDSVNWGPELSPAVCELMLARPPVGHFCASYFGGVCQSPRSYRVQAAHPAAPGLVAGDTVTLGSCCAWFEPARGARGLVLSEDAVVGVGAPPSAPARRMPALLAGSIGDGRALVPCIHEPRPLREACGGAGGASRFVKEALLWLAEPRRGRPIGGPA